MNRRSYLAGSALGAVTLLSGCLDSVGLGDDEDGTGDVTVPESEAPVDAEIRSAVGALNRAGLSLHGIEGGFDDPDELEYDPDRPLARIESAYDYLEAAEETGDRSEDVETLTEFADVLERTIDVIASLIEEDLTDEHEDAEAALEDERFDDARSIVQARNASVEDDRQRLEPAVETLERIDRERLEELDTIDVGPIDDGVGTLYHLLAGLEALTGAFESLIDGSESLRDGRDSFEEGLEAIEQAENATSMGELEEAKEDATRAFEDARSAFEDAQADFEESTTTLEGVEDPPAALTEQFETTACRSRTLEDVAAEFVAGTDAALEENFDAAKEHQETATELLEDAENCS